MWGTPANSVNNPATLHMAISVLKDSSACGNTQEHLWRLDEGFLNLAVRNSLKVK